MTYVHLICPNLHRITPYREDHTKKGPIWGDPTPNVLLFSTKPCTECPLFPFSPYRQNSNIKYGMSFKFNVAAF